MRIGVVTVTYNSGKVLPEFLDSVSRQTFTTFTLYVVDNCSQDATTAILATSQLPQLRIISNSRNNGIAGGNNQGIRAALADGCDAVLLINNDTVFGPDLFLKLVTSLAAGFAFATCKMYYFDRPNIIWAAGGDFQPLLGYRIRHRGKDRPDLERWNRPSSTISFAPFCCILIAREAFERIGLMDEKYFVYVEDVDFLYRARRARLSMQYVPVPLWHKVSSLTGGYSTFTIEHICRNRAYFLRKHLSLSWPAFASAYVAYYCLRFMILLDDVKTFRLKMRAFREGLKMSGQPHTVSAEGPRVRV